MPNELLNLDSNLLPQIKFEPVITMLYVKNKLTMPPICLISNYENIQMEFLVNFIGSDQINLLIINKLSVKNVEKMALEG